NSPPTRQRSAVSPPRRPRRARYWTLRVEPLRFPGSPFSATQLRIRNRSSCPRAFLRTGARRPGTKAGGFPTASSEGDAVEETAIDRFATKCPQISGSGGGLTLRFDLTLPLPSASPRLYLCPSKGKRGDV